MTADLFSLDAPAGVKPGPTAEEIYSFYPRKEHRLYAIQCINRAMKREKPAHLLAATKSYAAAIARWKEEDRHQYVPHCSSWFNKGGYLDDPKNWERKSSGKGRASFA